MYKYVCKYIQLYLCIHLYQQLYFFMFTYFFFVCNRLHLIKICLCCFLDMHLHSNSLSTIAIVSSLIMSEFFHACFYCNNSFNLSHFSLASDGKNFVENPEAMIAGDLSNFVSGLSLLLFRPFCLILNLISFPNS